MCRLRKIAVFEFFVSKLIDLDSTKIGKTTSREIEEFDQKLSDYTMARYMRLLYFLCLADAKQRGETETKSGGKLLSIFDNFVAYRNGPIEEDIYLNRQNEGVFTHFIFEEGRLKLRQKPDSLPLPEMVEEADQEAIVEALEELGQLRTGDTHRGKSILEQTDTVLVDLSHSLSQEVWPAAYYYSEQDGRISKILEDAEILQKEITAFMSKCITTRHRNHE